MLAVDPGERVGWALGTIINESDLNPAPVELVVERHGISFLKDAALAINKAVNLENRIDIVVYETFLLTARGAKVMVGSDLQTAQFVGMVRGYCWLNPSVQLVAQGPSAKRSALKSMRATSSGTIIQGLIDKMPKAHDSAHDGDALMHLYHYFFQRYV